MFDPHDLLQKKGLMADDDEGGDDGSDSGGSGFNEPIMDMAVFGLVQGRIREGERKYGSIPDPKDPFSEDEGLRSGKRLRGHPLLSKAAEFSGIGDRKNNPNPMQNPEAEKKYNELRNEYQLQAALRNSKQQRPTSAPTLTRR